MMPAQVRYVGPAHGERVFKRPAPKISNGFIRDILPLIAFDPGGTTGWSLLVLPREINGIDIFSLPFGDILKNRVIWEHGEIDCYEEDLGASAMMQLVQEYPNAGVVVEDFVLRADRFERSRNLLSPVRLTAKLEHYLWRTGRKMLLQQPSLAKTTVTDDRLKIWGCYVPGMPHARDADRHIITFIRRCYGPQGFPLRHNTWTYAYERGLENESQT